MANTKTQTKTRTKLSYPSKYKVVMHNDNVTPMEFVIQLLVEVFNKSIDEAHDITMAIHETGKATAGFYSYEVAEQKHSECSVICNYHGHPLKITIEEV